MAPAIKNVVVVGATGNLGPAVVSQLHAAGFAVTAVTRSKASSSLPSFPPDVAVKEVDFSSPASLAAVLDGQDAVVSTLGLGAILGGQQAALAEAAAAPGSSVRRFVPSEFGVDTRNVPIPNMRALLTAKVKAREDLEEKARLNPEFSWTALSVGYFFDWALDKGFLGFDAANRKATIVDSGDERFPASTLDFIGRAVASVLSHPEETANKYLLVASFNPSRNEILSILEELTGGAKWEVKREDSKSLRKLADEKFAAGEVGTAFPLFLNVYLFADGAGTALTEETSANKLLGVEGEDLRDVLRKWLVGAGVISS